MLPSLSFRSQRKLPDPHQLSHGGDATLVPFFTELHAGRAPETTLGWAMPRCFYLCQSATSWRDGGNNSPLTWTGYLDICECLTLSWKEQNPGMCGLCQVRTPPISDTWLLARCP